MNKLINKISIIVILIICILFNSCEKDGVYKPKARIKLIYESIQSYLGVHEYFGHGIKKYSGGQESGGTHWKAYEAQKLHPTYNKLPASQRDEINARIKEYLYYENYNLYQKYYGR